MRKTSFQIAKMDCPSEEQLVRMKLASLRNIEFLEFNLPKRQLTAYHSDGYEEILENLNLLNFDTTLIASVKAENFVPDSKSRELKLLWQVLAINFFFFLLELGAGFFSHSMGLIADSLDMLADSLVYGLALLAVGGTAARKKYTAKVAGYLQLGLAILGLMEVLRRFFWVEEIPAFQTMIAVSALALIGNWLCLYLLQKSKNKEAHMQASMIFTSNDIIVNLGVIMAAGLVYVSHSPYPDLVIGCIVFFLVGKGAFKILKLAE